MADSPLQKDGVTTLMRTRYWSDVTSPESALDSVSCVNVRMSHCMSVRIFSQYNRNRSLLSCKASKGDHVVNTYSHNRFSQCFLLILVAHAQRGLQYSVCMCVCACVRACGIIYCVIYCACDRCGRTNRQTNK